MQKQKITIGVFSLIILNILLLIYPTTNSRYVKIDPTAISYETPFYKLSRDPNPSDEEKIEIDKGLSKPNMAVFQLQYLANNVSTDNTRDIYSLVIDTHTNDSNKNVCTIEAIGKQSINPSEAIGSNVLKAKITCQVDTFENDIEFTVKVKEKLENDNFTFDYLKFDYRKSINEYLKLFDEIEALSMSIDNYINNLDEIEQLFYGDIYLEYKEYVLDVQRHSDDPKNFSMPGIVGNNGEFTISDIYKSYALSYVNARDFVAGSGNEIYLEFENIPLEKYNETLTYYINNFVSLNSYFRDYYSDLIVYIQENGGFEGIMNNQVEGVVYLPETQTISFTERVIDYLEINVYTSYVDSSIQMVDIKNQNQSTMLNTINYIFNKNVFQGLSSNFNIKDKEDFIISATKNCKDAYCQNTPRFIDYFIYKDNNDYVLFEVFKEEDNNYNTIVYKKLNVSNDVSINLENEENILNVSITSSDSDKIKEALEELNQFFNIDSEIEYRENEVTYSFDKLECVLITNELQRPEEPEEQPIVLPEEPTIQDAEETEEPVVEEIEKEEKIDDKQVPMEEEGEEEKEDESSKYLENPDITVEESSDITNEKNEEEINIITLEDDIK